MLNSIRGLRGLDSKSLGLEYRIRALRGLDSKSLGLGLIRAYGLEGIRVFSRFVAGFCFCGGCSFRGSGLELSFGGFAFQCFRAFGVRGCP